MLKPCAECGLDFEARTNAKYCPDHRSVADYSRRYRLADPDRNRAKNRRSRQRNPEANRANVRMWQHGMTLEDREQYISDHGTRCGICGAPESGGRGWTIDHDHGCCPQNHSCPRCRRGLLCNKCNLMLGNASDDVEILRNAILYLESFTLESE